MNQLVFWALAHADVVLFHVAPMLRSSDSAIVARQCDAAVLVVYKSETVSKDATRAAQLLRGTGTSIAGTVLANATPADVVEMPIQVQSQDHRDQRTAATPRRKRRRQAA